MNKFGIVSDLDGVLHRDDRVLPGAKQFLRDLIKSKRPYIFLTNSAEEFPQEIHDTLARLGLEIPPSAIFTAGEALILFLRCQRREPTVFLFGNQSLRKNMEQQGIRLVDKAADFVVFATGGEYTVELLGKAVSMIRRGSQFIVANKEAMGVTRDGVKPGCGALVAPIETTTGCKGFIVGKPNHQMIRCALDRIGQPANKCIMIGDYYETDVLVGKEAGMKTVLLLSGITQKKDLKYLPINPDYVFKNIGQLKLHKLP